MFGANLAAARELMDLELPVATLEVDVSFFTEFFTFPPPSIYHCFLLNEDIRIKENRLRNCIIDLTVLNFD
jgi:hypothetical protein